MKKNLDVNEILLEILKLMIPATPKHDYSGGIGRFLIDQVPAPEHTVLYLGVRGRSFPTNPRYDDFTCEQIAKLGDVGLDALATYAAYHTLPYTQGIVKHVRKFLDPQANQELDRLIEASKKYEEEFLAKDAAKRAQTEEECTSKKSDEDDAEISF